MEQTCLAVIDAISDQWSWVVVIAGETRLVIVDDLSDLLVLIKSTSGSA